MLSLFKRKTVYVEKIVSDDDNEFWDSAEEIEIEPEPWEQETKIVPSRHLSSCGLTKIPSDILKLKFLVVLHVDNNQIKELPRKIKNLTALRDINLLGNQITKFDNLCSLVNLEIVILADNEIEAIPEGVVRLEKLKTLNLTGNRVAKLGSPKLQKFLEKIANFSYKD